MRLYLDTADNLQTIVKLDEEVTVRHYQQPKDQEVVAVIQEALRRKGVGLEAITAIEVNQGPGSFTGLRVGCAVANALGWILDVPVNGQKGKPVRPFYEK